MSFVIIFFFFIWNHKKATGMYFQAEHQNVRITQSSVGDAYFPMERKFRDTHTCCSLGLHHPWHIPGVFTFTSFRSLLKCLCTREEPPYTHTLSKIAYSLPCPQLAHAFITPHTTSRIYRFICSLFVSPTGIAALCEQGLDCFAHSCIPSAWNSAWFTGRHSIIGAGWRQNTNEIVIGFFFFQLYCNKNI